MEPRARRALQAALPSYEVEGELGRGAFGVVYAARHTQLGRDVAIKVLPQVFAADEGVRARFVAEAQMVASLDHPHIVPVYDYVEDDEACMLIMERCATSVGDRFKEHGVATDEACAAVLSCLAALDLAHSRGVLHRDVKPENLMLDMKGTVKLADFGIARALDSDIRHTKTGMVVGTPAYMSPEQVRGDQLTGASDVYSVAMMAYELLTGTLPFPVTSAVTGLLAHHLTTEPIPLLSTRPELPQAIGEVIDRALTKSLDHRHATAVEFASDLSGACVRSFGSGWLRRRGFTLHWPDIVAENERPSNGRPAGTTGTITVHAMNEPHDVISPADALADWNDTLLAGGSPTENDETTTTGSTHPSRVASGVTPTDPPSGAPRDPGMSGTPTAPAPPAPPTRDATVVDTSVADGDGNRLVWTLGAVATLLVIAIVALLVVRSSGGEDSARGSDVDDAAPLDEFPTSISPIDAGPTTIISPTVVPTTVVATTVVATTVTGEPAAPVESVADTTLPVIPPVDDPADFSNRPASYVPQDARSALAPTPCPLDQPKVACIHAGVGVLDDTTGVINVSFFTQGFIPELEPAGDHVHFYFDTTVDGDEQAAGTGSAVAQYKPWDLPFDIVELQGDNGRTMFTVADARAADARYLCVIVATANQVALPGTGNCAPFFQTWDLETLARQVERIPGTFIGRCAIGVTAIVPDGWRSADLVAEPPPAAAGRLFPTDAKAEGVLQDLVDVGGVLYADGNLADGTQADLTASIFPGDYRIGSNPQQVADQLRLSGVDVGATSTEFIGGRPVLTSSTTRDALVSKRYFLPDFGYVIELDVTLDPGSVATVADRIADTVVGCALAE